MDQQLKGGYHDSLEIKYFKSREESNLFFSQLQKIFLNINSWENLFKKGTAFQVTDFNGNNKFSGIAVGDLVKIKIPGPKSRIGGGFDWVKICELEFHIYADYEYYCMVFSPCNKPGSEVTAHFFQSIAKNYFTIKNYGYMVTAEVHGRNEVANCSNLQMWDQCRNFLTAKGGIFGFSKIHWKQWCKSILDEKILNIGQETKETSIKNKK